MAKRDEEITPEELLKIPAPELFRIGMIHVYGMGCEKNLELGAKFLRVSAQKQYRPAVLKLAKLGPKYSGNVNTSAMKANTEKIEYMARYNEKKRILFVDDDEVLLSLISDIFSQFNIDKQMAQTGRAALDYLQKEKFDLVVMDYQLPQANGLQLVTSMRQVLHTSTPVVMLSGFGDDETIAAAKKMGVVAWVHKPVVPETLIETVRNYVLLTE
ncbi:MAG: response regulator [Zetaproteobacteria bacterium]|nr:response regulator [Zetaproteobacteria bacterium]